MQRSVASLSGTAGNGPSAGRSACSVPKRCWLLTVTDPSAFSFTNLYTPPHSGITFMYSKMRPEKSLAGKGGAYGGCTTPSSVKMSAFPKYMPVSKAATRAFFDASAGVSGSAGGAAVASVPSATVVTLAPSAVASLVLSAIFRSGDGEMCCSFSKLPLRCVGPKNRRPPQILALHSC